MRFIPPTHEQRITAAGLTSRLPELLRLALEPHDDFEPVPHPGPHDWLANHEERGQNFEQFVRSRPNRPDSRHQNLYLQPLYSVDESEAPALDRLQNFMAAFFMTKVKVLPCLKLLPTDIAHRRNPVSGQMQLLTGDILSMLTKRIPEDAFALLGITLTDLYPDPKWNFVFGEASMRDRVGVYSFARYDPRFYGPVPGTDVGQLILRRSCKVLAHETTHMFGVKHCIWYRCLMNGSNHMDESDARPLHLCPVDLRKLQWSIGFNIAERYRRLRDFHQAEGFSDEAGWLDKRIGFLELHEQDANGP
jgi:archaemetzincin